MATYKIAPTDLTFLLDQCPLCFVRKVKHKIVLKTAFPSIFHDIHDVVEKGAHAGEPADFDIPGEYFDRPDKTTIASAPLPVGNDFVVLNGREDKLGAIQADDSFLLVDLKTSKPKPDYERLYWRQLMSYYTIRQNPADTANFRNVSGMGLLWIQPEIYVDLKREMQRLHAVGSFIDALLENMNLDKRLLTSWKYEYTPIEIDQEAFDALLVDVVDLLNTPLPDIMPGDKCGPCLWARQIANL